jgi:hypothetical protein
MSGRAYNLLLTDLVDTLTIDQIKEVLLPTGAAATREMAAISADLDALLAAGAFRPSGRLVRLVALLSLANQQTWFNKDRMQEDPGRYGELLEFAQELNGLRNHVRNLLMNAFHEDSPATRRATFLDPSGSHWYSAILEQLEP